MSAQQGKAHLDNHANQLNLNNQLYRPKHEEPGYVQNEAAMKLRSRQLNPNNALYRAPK
jgi:hypothetical protein